MSGVFDLNSIKALVEAEHPLLVAGHDNKVTKQ